jgi:hypothetical protein
MFLVWFLEPRVMFLYTALYYWFFITEMECIYFVVRTGSLHLFYVYLGLVGLT